MLLIEEIIDQAYKKGASDIHLVSGMKPILRVKRNLQQLGDKPLLDQDILWEIYDYIIQGDVELDKFFKDNRRLDTSLVWNSIRLRVNVSLSDEKPIFTMRIVPDKLPKFEELGLPEIIRKMLYQPQGLFLVTGKTNSGKSTTLNALITEINETQNKKILTLENPIEYKHTSKKSFIVQKEVGIGKDSLNFRDGVMNALREDCDILIIGEIRDKETMEAAIDMVESGHLVIGTLHTKSCAETIDRMISFYEVKEQTQIKNLLSGLLKIVVSQRLLRHKDGESLVLVPEVMMVDNIVGSCIRKEKFSVPEIEDAIQSSSAKGSISLTTSLAKLVVEGKIALDLAKSQLEPKNIETLNRTIAKLS